ncbi:PaaI family thioesterase [Poriferisphaera sp. WC338]|uniref:PaaI family thioesterase n=1 Tax=Poriferisphaera sp. WC338 TaxID=3425129 RepID=UPI003D8153B2
MIRKYLENKYQTHHGGEKYSLRDRLHTGCFACDDGHLFGLKLRCALKDGGERAVGRFKAADWMRSYAGCMHGGLVSTLLDSAMTQFLLLHGEEAVTGTLEVRFRHPADLEGMFEVVAWRGERRGRVHRMRSELRDGDGMVVAEARAQFVMSHQ